MSAGQTTHLAFNQRIVGVSRLSNVSQSNFPSLDRDGEVHLLRGTLSFENSWHRLSQDLQIEPERPLIHVLEI